MADPHAHTDQHLHELGKWDFEVLAVALQVYVLAETDALKRTTAENLRQRFYRAEGAFIVSDAGEGRALDREQYGQCWSS